MGEWLNLMRQKNPNTYQDEPTKLTKGSFVGFVSSSHMESENFLQLQAELILLNERWQKALSLEQEGAFIGKTPEAEEKICCELRKIIGRATDI